MKLIYAIIRYDNEDDVTTSLTKHKFSVTRLSTTGGFLKKGNTSNLKLMKDIKIPDGYAWTSIGAISDDKSF